METKTVNLRDLPVDLVRRAKAYAALRGMTLKDFVVHAMNAALEKDIPAMPASGAVFGVPRRGMRRRKKN